MRNLTAIFLLSILLFNLVGYKALFQYLQQRADIQLQVSLDKEQYNSNDLITVKVPLSLPYQTNWKEFERVDGEIKLDGKIYKYVKRKVYNGELILLCLRDNNKMHLQTAKDDFFKLANDMLSNNSKKQSSGNLLIIKNILSEFDSPFTPNVPLKFVPNQLYEYPRNSHFNSSLALRLPEQPPELA